MWFQRVSSCIEARLPGFDQVAALAARGFPIKQEHGLDHITWGGVWMRILGGPHRGPSIKASSVFGLAGESEERAISDLFAIVHIYTNQDNT